MDLITNFSYKKLCCAASVFALRGVAFTDVMRRFGLCTAFLDNVFFCVVWRFGLCTPFLNFQKVDNGAQFSSCRVCNFAGQGAALQAWLSKMFDHATRFGLR